MRRFGAGRVAQWAMASSPPLFALIVLVPSGVAVAAVFAAFEFAGLLWNSVSVSYRQRHIPDALLGRVNSLYRMMAWGMMPLGLLLSGLTIRLAEGSVGRDLALTLPFWLAAAGTLALTVAAWRGIGRGFAQTL